MDPLTPYRRRGAPSNLQNRFEKLAIERDPENESPDDPAPSTTFLIDSSKSLISTNDSPDLGFSASFNPYRGCEHGCIYCYARPSHEYAGMSCGLDFESKILVKKDAPELLRRELAAPRWVPQVLMVSGVTDCYQPVERRLRLTRRCMEVLAECRNPAGVISKNVLLTRDIDVFQEMARYQCIHVTVSVTTLDLDLQQKMEPRAAAPQARVNAIRTLAQAGIPVGVNVAPIIPGLTDHEMPEILKRCRDAGAQSAGFTVVRLPYGVKGLFSKWLDAHYPGMKSKILGRIQEVRNGKLNDPRFGSRMRGEGPYAEHLHRLFKIARHKVGYPERMPGLSTASFRRPSGPQLTLFD